MMNMQDPSTHQQQQQQQQQIKPQQFPEQQEHLKCPRCDSNNTKFCYYNNYNLSQPRHFCKNCRRYWTKGGSLRNIPVGGGSRKNNTKRSSNPKRHSSNSSSSPSSVPNSTTNESSTSLLNALNSGLNPEPSSIYGAPVDQDCGMLDINGSFRSLLASSGQFGSLLAGMNPNGPGGVRTLQIGEFTQGLNSNTGLGLDMGRTPDLELESGNHSESFLGIQSGDSSCWSAGEGGINGWPDLTI